MFWNINKKNLSLLVAELAFSKGIDIIILAEFESLDVNHLMKQLHKIDKKYSVEKVLGSDRILLIHRFGKQLSVIREQRHSSSFIIKSTIGDILLVALHLSSRLHNSIDGLNMMASEYSREISKLEQLLGTERTLVVGDFNMNPFEIGMSAINAFNSVMCPSIANRKVRKKHDFEYKYFFNPMWHLMGNSTSKALGSYYYSGDNISVYWNTFDQVLYRPEMIPYIDVHSIYFITEIEQTNLLTAKGLPCQSTISDHLPLSFELSLEVKYE